MSSYLIPSNECSTRHILTRVNEYTRGNRYRVSRVWCLVYRHAFPPMYASAHIDAQPGPRNMSSRPTTDAFFFSFCIEVSEKRNGRNNCGFHPPELSLSSRIDPPTRYLPLDHPSELMIMIGLPMGDHHDSARHSDGDDLSTLARPLTMSSRERELSQCPSGYIRLLAHG